MAIKSKLNAEKLALLSGLFFSLVNVTDKFAVSEANPVWIGFFRVVSSLVLIFLAMIFFKESFRISKKMALKFVFISFLYGIGTIFLMNSIKLAGISIAIAMLNLNIILSPVIAFLFLKEKVNPGVLSAIILAFAGVLAVIIGQNGLELQSSWQTGILFGIGVALFWSAQQNLIKLEFKNDISPIKATFFTTAFSAPIILAFATLYPFTISLQDIAIISLSGFLVGIGGILIFMAMSKGDISKTIPIYGATQPLIASIMGFIVFKENISVITLIGILFITSSLFMLNKKK